MEFQQVHNNIWYVRQPLDLFGIDMGTVMTIVRIEYDGSLVVHCPVDPTDELVEEIDKLGTVKAVISPNRFHAVHAQRFMEYYPESTYYYSPGLDRKVPRRALPIANRDELTSDLNASWHGELVALKITGMPFINEFVFYHKQSRSLIASGLLSHVEQSSGIWSKIFWPMLGIKVGTPGQSWLFRLCIRDKSLYNKSIQRLLQLDFDRVILSHGTMIEARGSEIVGGLAAV